MRWMWVDKIVAFEPGERMVTVKHASLAEGHLHDHFPRDGDLDARPIMPATLILEGMAQTAGILVGAQSFFKQKIILAKVLDAALDEEVEAGESIRYDATIVRSSETGAATDGTVERMRPVGRDAGTWMPIGTINLMFSNIDRNMSGQRFPEENFVFSDNFRTLLNNSTLPSLEPYKQR